jgi:SET domain-containing protein
MRYHPPHHNVYVRIAPSKTHGVGVKAIRPIKKGTYIFRGDAVPLIWISQSRVKNSPRELARLYKDFAISKRGKYGCPPSFNMLTPAWYLNCSKRANVACDENYDFYALKDIKKGTELTVNYKTFSE